MVSGDKNLLSAFKDRGGDLHSKTTQLIFHPEMTVEEFIKVKEIEPYKLQRSICKGVNFQFLFGGSAWAFAKDVLEKEWTLDHCFEFLKSNGLTTKDQPFLEAATFIRDSFFKSYPELLEWHRKIDKEADTGVVRYVYGGRRLLPKLIYQGRDTDMKEVNDAHNIGKNSPIQNIEAVVIMRAMRKIHQFIKENKLKSRIFGTIHDAVTFYIYKDEADLMYKKIIEFFEKREPEYNGILFEYELNKADPMNKDHPTSWAFGESWKQ